MAVQFAVLASGSRGNATLVRAGGAGLLVDLGLGPRALKQRLETVGACWESITSALLTHTHGDHIDELTLSAMAKRRMILYCHEGHRDELCTLSAFRSLDDAGLIRHYDDTPFLTPNGMRVEPLELRHDAGATFGFRIEAKANRKSRSVGLGYMADTGSWSERCPAMTDVDLLSRVQSRRRHAAPVSRSQALTPKPDWGTCRMPKADFVSAVLEKSSGVRASSGTAPSESTVQSPDLAARGSGRVERQVGAGSRRAAIAAHPSVWVEPASSVDRGRLVFLAEVIPPCRPILPAMSPQARPPRPRTSAARWVETLGADDSLTIVGDLCDFGSRPTGQNDPMTCDGLRSALSGTWRPSGPGIRPLAAPLIVSSRDVGSGCGSAGSRHHQFATGPVQGPVYISSGTLNCGGMLNQLLGEQPAPARRGTPASCRLPQLRPPRIGI